jgi:heterodisulfide reductase subunit C
MPETEERTQLADEAAHANPYSVIAESNFHEPPPAHRELATRIANDPRMHDHVEGFLSCMQCGICTSACPAARFGDYSPREIARRALDGDPTLLTDDSVWLCFYCYTCQSRCPRGNSVAVINQIIRGLQVEEGYGKKHVAMFTAWAEQFYDKGIGGTPQVFFADRVAALGPKWRRFIERRDDLRNELGLGSMFPSPAAAAEMRTIMDETGFRERLLSLGAWGGDTAHRP